jgi:hypothetical protein
MPPVFITTGGFRGEPIMQANFRDEELDQALVSLMLESAADFSHSNLELDGKSLSEIGLAWATPSGCQAWLVQELYLYGTDEQLKSYRQFRWAELQEWAKRQVFNVVFYYCVFHRKIGFVLNEMSELHHNGYDEGMWDSPENRHAWLLTALQFRLNSYLRDRQKIWANWRRLQERIFSDVHNDVQSLAGQTGDLTRKGAALMHQLNSERNDFTLAQAWFRVARLVLESNKAEEDQILIALFCIGLYFSPDYTRSMEKLITLLEKTMPQNDFNPVETVLFLKQLKRLKLTLQADRSKRSERIRNFVEQNQLARANFSCLDSQAQFPDGVEKLAQQFWLELEKDTEFCRLLELRENQAARNYIQQSFEMNGQTEEDKPILAETISEDFNNKLSTIFSDPAEIVADFREDEQNLHYYAKLVAANFLNAIFRLVENVNDPYLLRPKNILLLDFRTFHYKVFLKRIEQDGVIFHPDLDFSFLPLVPESALAEADLQNQLQAKLALILAEICTGQPAVTVTEADLVIPERLPVALPAELATFFSNLTPLDDLQAAKDFLPYNNVERSQMVAEFFRKEAFKQIGFEFCRQLDILRYNLSHQQILASLSNYYAQEAKRERNNNWDKHYRTLMLVAWGLLQA